MQISDTKEIYQQLKKARIKILVPLIFFRSPPIFALFG